MSTQTKTKTKASDMLVLAALAYLLTLVAPFLNGFAPANNLVVSLILRAVCIAAWVFGAWGLVITAKKECGYNVVDKNDKPSTLQWILTAVVTVVFLAYCTIDGLDSIQNTLATLEVASDYVYFITYHIMNVAQALVVTLIVVFAQKAGDKLGLGKYIPYGGIALGLCWAVVSLIGSTDLIFPTVGNILIPALWRLAYGIVFGVIYLVSGKKPIYALPFMTVAFVLM